MTQPLQVTDKAYIGKHSPLKCKNSFIHFFFDHVGTNEKRICKQILFPTRNAEWGISPVATGDQRPTALDPCRLLKKSGENFVQCVSGDMFVSGSVCFQLIKPVSIENTCSIRSRSSG